MPQDPVADRLRRAPIPDRLRADAWDAFDQASDADDLARRLAAIQMPDEVKADLWDLKAGAPLKAETPKAKAPPLATLGEIAKESAAKRFASGLGDSIASTVKGAAGLAKSMVTPRTEGPMRFVPPAMATQLEVVGSLYDAAVDQAAKGFTAAGEGRYTEAAGHAGAALLPGVGPAAANIGEQAASGDVAGAAGQTTGLLVAMALPKVAPKVVKAARNATAASLTNLSERAVQAAVKPTVSALKRISGAMGEGLDAKAKSLVRFIIDNRLTTPDKAQKLIVSAEQDLQRALSVKNAPTDAATRAARYIEALKRSASKQAMPADDVALLEKASAELLNGPMGKDVIKLVQDESGQWVPEVSRKLRDTVPAKEALVSARASSRWSTNKQWGEQKGTTMEAQKAVERAQRDAVKDAVPGAREALGTQAKAIKAQEVLDRMQQRTANRDAVSLPAHVVGAAEIASGKVPLMAFAANWLRNNQMKVGIWGDRLAKAIKANNVAEVSEILSRLGATSAVKEAATSPIGLQPAPAGGRR